MFSFVNGDCHLRKVNIIIVYTVCGACLLVNVTINLYVVTKYLNMIFQKYCGKYDVISLESLLNSTTFIKNTP